MYQIDFPSWLAVRFGTNRPRWQVSDDSNALRLYDNEGNVVGTIVLSSTLAQIVRSLQGSITAVPLQATFEGEDFPVVLIGKRVDTHRWQGVAIDSRDSAAILQEMTAGLGYGEQVLSEIGTLVVIIDVHGTIKRFNRECERLSGLKEADVLGKNALSIFFPSDEASAIQTNLTVFFDTMETWETERRTLTRNGERIIRWRNRLVRSGTVDQWFLICSGIDVTDERHAQSALERHIHLDELTELPNTRSAHTFIDSLRSDPRKATASSSLVLLTFQHFSRLNEIHGRAAGDAILCSVVALLRSLAGEDAFIARVGGVEFLLVMKTPITKAKALCKDLQAAFQSIELPVGVSASEIQCSLGLARRPKDGATLDDLLDVLRQAAWQARNVKCGFHVFGTAPVQA